MTIINATCDDRHNNINALEKDKFQYDINGDVCVNTCIAKPSGDGLKFVYASGSDTPGSEYCFLSCVVPAGKLLKLEQIIAAFQQSGEFLVKVGGNTIMRLVTSPAQPTISIKLENSIPIAESEVVEICFCTTEEGEYSATLIGNQTTL